MGRRRRWDRRRMWTGVEGGTGEGGGVTSVRRLVHVVGTAELSREGRSRERGGDGRSNS